MPVGFDDDMFGIDLVIGHELLDLKTGTSTRAVVSYHWSRDIGGLSASMEVNVPVYATTNWYAASLKETQRKPHYELHERSSSRDSR